MLIVHRPNPPAPAVSLKERIAALQQKSAAGVSSHGSRSTPQQYAPLSAQNTGTSNASGAHGDVLKSRIAAFEEKGGVPVPRGRFGMGAPPTKEEADRRRNEMYGNRMQLKPNRTGGAYAGLTPQLTGQVTGDQFLSSNNQSRSLSASGHEVPDDILMTNSFPDDDNPLGVTRDSPSIPKYERRFSAFSQSPPTHLLEELEEYPSYLSSTSQPQSHSPSPSPSPNVTGGAPKLTRSTSFAKALNIARQAEASAAPTSISPQQTGTGSSTSGLSPQATGNWSYARFGGVVEAARSGQGLDEPASELSFDEKEPDGERREDRDREEIVVEEDERGHAPATNALGLDVEVDSGATQQRERVRTESPSAVLSPSDSVTSIPPAIVISPGGEDVSSELELMSSEPDSEHESNNPDLESIDHLDSEADDGLEREAVLEDSSLLSSHLEVDGIVPGKVDGIVPEKVDDSGVGLDEEEEDASLLEQPEDEFSSHEHVDERVSIEDASSAAVPSSEPSVESDVTTASGEGRGAIFGDELARTDTSDARREVTVPILGTALDDTGENISGTASVPERVEKEVGGEDGLEVSPRTRTPSPVVPEVQADEEEISSPASVPAVALESGPEHNEAEVEEAELEPEPATPTAASFRQSLSQSPMKKPELMIQSSVVRSGSGSPSPSPASTSSSKRRQQILHLSPTRTGSLLETPASPSPSLRRHSASSVGSAGSGAQSLVMSSRRTSYDSPSHIALAHKVPSLGAEGEAKGVLVATPPSSGGLQTSRSGSGRRGEWPYDDVDEDDEGDWEDRGDDYDDGRGDHEYFVVDDQGRVVGSATGADAVFEVHEGDDVEEDDVADYIEFDVAEVQSMPPSPMPMRDSTVQGKAQTRNGEEYVEPEYDPVAAKFGEGYKVVVHRRSGAPGPSSKGNANKQLPRTPPKLRIRRIHGDQVVPMSPGGYADLATLVQSNILLEKQLSEGVLPSELPAGYHLRRKSRPPTLPPPPKSDPADRTHLAVEDGAGGLSEKKRKKSLRNVFSSGLTRSKSGKRKEGEDAPPVPALNNGMGAEDSYSAQGGTNGRAAAGSHANDPVMESSVRHVHQHRHHPSANNAYGNGSMLRPKTPPHLQRPRTAPVAETTAPLRPKTPPSSFARKSSEGRLRRSSEEKSSPPPPLPPPKTSPNRYLNGLKRLASSARPSSIVGDINYETAAAPHGQMRDNAGILDSRPRAGSSFAAYGRNGETNARGAMNSTGVGPRVPQHHPKSSSQDSRRRQALRHSLSASSMSMSVSVVSSEDSFSVITPPDSVGPTHGEFGILQKPYGAPGSGKFYANVPAKKSTGSLGRFADRIMGMGKGGSARSRSKSNVGLVAASSAESALAIVGLSEQARQEGRPSMGKRNHTPTELLPPLPSMPGSDVPHFAVSVPTIIPPTPHNISPASSRQNSDAPEPSDNILEKANLKYNHQDIPSPSALTPNTTVITTTTTDSVRSSTGDRPRSYVSTTSNNSSIGTKDADSIFDAFPSVPPLPPSAATPIVVHPQHQRTNSRPFPSIDERPSFEAKRKAGLQRS